MPLYLFNICSNLLFQRSRTRNPEEALAIYHPGVLWRPPDSVLGPLMKGLRQKQIDLPSYLRQRPDKVTMKHGEINYEITQVLSLPQTVQLPLLQHIPSSAA